MLGKNWPTNVLAGTGPGIHSNDNSALISGCFGFVNEGQCCGPFEKLYFMRILTLRTKMCVHESLGLKKTEIRYPSNQWIDPHTTEAPLRKIEMVCIGPIFVLKLYFRPF